jgi:hypothetical protein
MAKADGNIKGQDLKDEKAAAAVQIKTGKLPDTGQGPALSEKIAQAEETADDKNGGPAAQGADLFAQAAGKGDGGAPDENGDQAVEGFTGQVEFFHFIHHPKIYLTADSRRHFSFLPQIAADHHEKIYIFAAGAKGAQIFVFFNN